jgi:hypothetical protein
MNINDVELQDQDTTKDRLELIFDKQRYLHKKYSLIEIKNGIGCGILREGQFNIDDARSQALIKDFCWRVVEELAEAHEAYILGEKDHSKEEVADAFHFLIELCIIVGLRPENLITTPRPGQDMLEHVFEYNMLTSEFHIGFSDPIYLCPILWSITQNLGLACNCLKNKAWKQTQMETDVKKFKKQIIIAFNDFIIFCLYMEMSENDLFKTYFKKSEVNKFRIRSKY